MSGDSPNTLSNENVFDFNPTPTTSKDQPPLNIISASALVEPSKETTDKDNKNKDDGNKNDDEPNINSPIFNNPDDGDNGRDSDAEKTIEMDDDDHRERGGGGGGGLGRGIGGKKGNNEEGKLLNGGNDNVDGTLQIKNIDDQDDSCIVNCLYYSIECCQCSIM